MRTSEGEAQSVLTERVFPLALPAVHLFEAVFRASVDQTVPSLPTTALRGALLRSLKDLVCLELARTECAGCPHAPSCAYPGLVEPRDEQGHELPSPLVLRPEFDVRDDDEIPLKAGEELRFHVGLIGDEGLENASLLRAALPVVARRGLGLKTREGATRPGLALVSFTRLAPPPPPPESSEWILQFATPLRLTVDGAVAGRLDGSVLWAGVVRRVRALAALYGAGAPALPLEAPWEVKDLKTSVVTVRRYSDRQHRRMDWPGVVGFARLRLIGDVSLASRLLRFVEAVQLGKATQFGFGAVRCEPVMGNSRS